MQVRAAEKDIRGKKKKRKETSKITEGKNGRQRERIRRSVQEDRKSKKLQRSDRKEVKKGIGRRGGKEWKTRRKRGTNLQEEDQERRKLQRDIN